MPKIDLSKFLKIFIEESMELLQSMETALLHLDITAVDLEKINQAFRSVHTIKSSSASLALESISSFAHKIESFLEPLRSGNGEISQQEVDLLLLCVDCMRQMMAEAEQKGPIDDRCAQQLLHDLAKLQKSQPQSATTETPTIKSSSIKQQDLSRHKVIVFRPDPTLWQKGNDIGKIFQAIAKLGEIKVKVNTENLPTLTQFDPTICYLQWKIDLQTSVNSEVIADIFNWVSTKENVQIEEIIPEPATIPKQPSLMTSIRVSIEKIDDLINLVGELIITQSMLNQIGKDQKDNEKLSVALSLLEHNTRALQEAAIQIRMLPIAMTLNRFPRVIHDLAEKTGKQVEYLVSGEQTEIDRSIMEKVSDPLLHLIRNAIDHGIETPEIRRRLGKPAMGTLQIHATQAGGNIIIEIIDDGSGLDVEAIRAKAIEKGLVNSQEELSHEQICALLFKSGFSTATQVTEVSGRGVGLDVVYQGVQELGGSIEINTVAGKGTTFTLRLPLTLAIVECQLIAVRQQVYAISLLSIIELIKIDSAKVNVLDNKLYVYHFREEHIPMIFLEKLFLENDIAATYSEKFLIVVKVNNKSYGLVCDDLKSQQQIVIKSLQDNYRKVVGLSGATILGDGHVALIIDVNAIVDLYRLPIEQSIEMKMETVTEEIDTSQSLQLLSFYLAGQEYALNMLQVLELRPWESVTKLPNVPKLIQGVINLRGLIIPIIDLRPLFELSLMEYNDKNAIIIIELHTERQSKVAGIIVDSISETYSIMGHNILPLPEGIAPMQRQYMQGLISLDDRLITLINIGHLLS